MPTPSYDVVVVGSGTAGATAAHACADAGLSVALVERTTPGGTCALRGCQPKKYLVVQAELAGLAEDLEGKGMGRRPVMDWQQALLFRRAFTDAVPQKTRRGLAKAGIDLIPGTASFAGTGVLMVDGREIRGQSFILATGALPRKLDVPGGDLTMTSDDFLELESLPPRPLFVGGGYISFEFAHVAAAFGARPVILHRSERPLGGFDPELADLAVEAARAAGIDVRLEHEPVEIEARGEEKLVRCGNGETVEASAVFRCIGRVPHLDHLELGVLGLEPGPAGLKVDDRMRVEGRTDLLAIGDCVDSPALAPVADREALVAASTLTGGDLRMDDDIVPSVCFCRPPLARLGLTEKEARNQGLEFEVREGDTTDWPNLRRLGARFGRYRILVGDGGRILGAHLLGEGSSDLINLFTLAMTSDTPLATLKEIVWAYPTLSSDVKYMA